MRSSVPFSMSLLQYHDSYSWIHFIIRLWPIDVAIVMARHWGEKSCNYKVQLVDTVTITSKKPRSLTRRKLWHLGWGWDILQSLERREGKHEFKDEIRVEGQRMDWNWDTCKWNCKKMREDWAVGGEWFEARSSWTIMSECQWREHESWFEHSVWLDVGCGYCMSKME